MKVKALVNFEYPASLTVRNRIRGGEKIPYEDRGKILEVEAGEMINAPADLLHSWVDAKLVEDPEETAFPEGEGQVNDGT